MNLDETVPARNVPTLTGAGITRGQVTHEQAARRAEKLWRERNQPSGQDDPIWLEAEAQLKAEAEARAVSGTESRPYIDEPAQRIRPQTKSRDPADSAAQTRSATDPKAKNTAGRLRHQ